MQLTSGNNIHQHNNGDGDKTCGDGDVTSSPCHSLVALCPKSGAYTFALCKKL